MPDLPTPVLSSIGTRQVTLRYFRSPYYEAFCNNCAWISFTYAKEDEADSAGEAHAERCCAYLNETIARQIEVEEVAAPALAIGHHILLRDLRTMEVLNVNVFDDEVAVTYCINGGYNESDIIMLPVDKIVKVLA